MKKLILLICAGAGALMAQAPTIASVVNASINSSTVLAPGILATIYGSGFGSGNASSVTVTVGGQAAYVIGLTQVKSTCNCPSMFRLALPP
jgi:hypothetical protein